MQDTSNFIMKNDTREHGKTLRKLVQLMTAKINQLLFGAPTVFAHPSILQIQTQSTLDASKFFHFYHKHNLWAKLCYIAMNNRWHKSAVVSDFHQNKVRMLKCPALNINNLF